MALELKAGDTFGEFRVLRVLRRYPHAWVYLVETPGGGPVRELKVSLQPVQSEQAAQRALREVAVIGTLTNKHVVAVHDSGLGPNDHWFILMDHLQGAQLNHWHDFDRPLPATDAVRFIHQACLGLAEVHAEGIVHRDLKPERLWVEPDGTLKIMDFSSARSWGEDATGVNVTVGMVVAGTPQYAAPEQMMASELTPAADVYSLGVLLYEMLSGHSPFFPDKPWSRAAQDLLDDPAGWYRAHASTPPTPLIEHPGCADLPAKLVGLVHQCLEKDPGSRPENASALANELGWILHHDLGAAQAAIVRAQGPGGATTFNLILPGSHRVGFGPDVDVVIGEGGPNSTLAVVEWAGPPKPAEIVPEDGVALTIGGEPAQGRTPIEGDQSIGLADSTLTLSYPK